MRSLLTSLLFAIPLGLCACGGATDTLGGGGGPGDSGTGDGGDAGFSHDGGGGGLDGTSGPDGAVDCNALLAQVNQLQAQAQTCCAQCDIVQCTSAVTGLCCDVSVTVPTSAATQAFEAAVTQYHQECPSECPALSCPKAPSGICDVSGVCQ
jgi:hypothetical protein